MTEPEIKLFLSVDIYGSTNLKNTSSYSSILSFCKENKEIIKQLLEEKKININEDFEITEDVIYNVIRNSKIHKDWSEIIKELFNDFNVEFNNQLSISHEVFPWKILGDELIYCIDVQGRQDIYDYTLAFYKALRIHDKKYSENPIIRLKGSAWTAGFPIRNRIIETPIPKLYLDSNFQKSYKYPHIDYLGPEMDIGFRIGKCTYPGFIVISLELAYFLTDDKTCGIPGEQFHVFNVGWEKLKGVWNDRKYPILWLQLPDTFNEIKEYFYEPYKLWDKEDNDLLKTYDGLKDSKENYITNTDIVKIIKQLPESLSITTPYIKKDNDSVPDIHQGLTEFIRKIQDFEEELTDQNAKLIKEDDSESLKNAQSKIDEFLKTELTKK